MRFKSIFTRKEHIDQVNKTDGQMIFCEDSGELYFDTPDNDRVQVGFKGHTRTFNILLNKDNWTNNGIEYVQMPDYSTEIFRGKLYDDSVNVVITPSQNNTEIINIIARPNGDNTRLEFVSDILPTTDIIMNVMTV